MIEPLAMHDRILVIAHDRDGADVECQKAKNISYNVGRLIQPVAVRDWALVSA